LRKATVAQPRKTPGKAAVLECRIQITSHRKQRKKYAKKGLDPFAFATLIALLCACSDTAQQPETEKPKIRIGGHYTGIDVEIAEEACARIGYEPIFVELDIDKGFELLNEDYVDCLWCCLTMESNEDKFIWAGPYMYTQRVVVVPAL
jgi:ABC-type amino acid transport substrate-binding protein